MKSNLLTLTRVLLKNGINLGAGSKKRSSRLGFTAVLVICFIPLISMLAGFVSSIYDVLADLGQDGLILTSGIGMSALVIFVFGIFYVINIFYFSEDVENLLYLPLKPSQILGAKFTVVTLYEYITSGMILWPIFIVFGMKSGAGPLYYIYAALIFLLVPVIPLTAASIIIMVIMRFTNLFRNKDMFKMMGGILALAFGLGLNAAIQWVVARQTDLNQLQRLLAGGENSLMTITSRMSPVSTWAAKSLVDSHTLAGVLNLLLFIGVSVLAFFIFLYLAEKLYFKGVIGLSQTSAKGAVLTGRQLERVSAEKSPVRSYALKELRILLRTPVYFLNCILVNFILPVLLLIPMLSRQQGIEGLQGALDGYLRGGRVPGMVLGIIFGALMFFGSLNGITSTAISREGHGMFVNKYIPLSYRRQILGKLIPGVVMGGAGMIVLVSIATAVFKPPAHLVAMAIILGILAVLFSSLVGLLLDIKNPKLNWDSEQQAVKQNLNVLLNMVICILAAGAAIFVTYISNMGLWTAFAALLIGFIIIDVLLYRLLMTRGVKLIIQLED
ncbi:MAG TPA: hypothetical protein GXZ32_05505 [Clostridiales bacterium]|nr:hypothetical protein [Clostridiales bacterium]